MAAAGVRDDVTRAVVVVLADVVARLRAAGRRLDALILEG